MNATKKVRIGPFLCQEILYKRGPRHGQVLGYETMDFVPISFEGKKFSKEERYQWLVSRMANTIARDSDRLYPDSRWYEWKEGNETVIVRPRDPKGWVPDPGKDFITKIFFRPKKDNKPWQGLATPREDQIGRMTDDEWRPHLGGIVWGTFSKGDKGLVARDEETGTIVIPEEKLWDNNIPLGKRIPMTIIRHLGTVIIAAPASFKKSGGGSRSAILMPGSGDPYFPSDENSSSRHYLLAPQDKSYHNIWKILGLDPAKGANHTKKEVRSAYRKAELITHDDKIVAAYRNQLSGWKDALDNTPEGDVARPGIQKQLDKIQAVVDSFRDNAMFIKQCRDRANELISQKDNTSPRYTLQELAEELGLHPRNLMWYCWVMLGRPALHTNVLVSPLAEKKIRAFFKKSPTTSTATASEKKFFQDNQVLPTEAASDWTDLAGLCKETLKHQNTRWVRAFLALQGCKTGTGARVEEAGMRTVLNEDGKILIFAARWLVRYFKENGHLSLSQVAEFLSAIYGIEVSWSELGQHLQSLENVGFKEDTWLSEEQIALADAFFMEKTVTKAAQEGIQPVIQPLKKEELLHKLAKRLRLHYGFEMRPRHLQELCEKIGVVDEGPNTKLTCAQAGWILVELARGSMHPTATRLLTIEVIAAQEGIKVEQLIERLNGSFTFVADANEQEVGPKSLLPDDEGIVAEIRKTAQAIRLGA